MQNLGRRRRALCTTTLLTAAVIAAFPAAAIAKDLPPTSDGAQKLSDTFAAYLGKAGSAAAKVVVEGDHYALSVDIAALYAPLSAAGFSVDPALLKYDLTQRDEGTWRVASDSLPPIALTMKNSKIAYNFGDYKFDGVFDPALPGFKSGEASVAKIALSVESEKPAFTETVDIANVHATMTGAPAPSGAVSFGVHEDLGALALNITPKEDSGGKEGGDDGDGDGKDSVRPLPGPITFEVGGGVADVSADGVPFRKLLDVWAFLAAHPTRPEIAANEEAFKALLRGLAPSELKLSEKVDLKSITVSLPQGRFTMTGGKFGVSAATGAGPKGMVEYSVAADGFSMPPGMLPPGMGDFVPTSFNLGIRASGFDAAAGAEEAIKDMHFAGDEKLISDADGQQILAKLKGAAPIVVDLLPSHVVAPQLDATVEGQLRIEGDKPSGVLKIRVRNFDKSVVALKALGPIATPQMLGGLALAKTLAKSESDGALTWLAEYSADGAVKVNGMPLGKAAK
jgi:hypothetical protein